MIHVPQPPNSYSCGQACIAMVTGLSFDEAWKLVGHLNATGTQEIVQALRKAGIRCAGRLHRVSRRWLLLPQHAIVAVRRRGYKTSTHWVVYWEGKVYDPGDKLGTPPIEAGKQVPAWDMTAYLEIYGRDSDQS